MLRTAATEGGPGIIDTDLYSDGRYGELLIQPGGGSRHPATHETVDKRHALRKMKGNEVFKVAVRMFGDCAERILARNGFTADDLALFVPHQANLRIIEAAVKRLKVPMERVIVNVDRYGNTGAASVYVALEEAWIERPPQDGRSRAHGGLWRRLHVGRGAACAGRPMKIAFLFPGRARRRWAWVGPSPRTSPAATAVWRKADEALGFSLSRLCFEGPEADLALTANTQPAILTASVAAAAVLSERGISPDLCAGHSLGEYSALVVTGALGFVDAIRLVRKRGEFMQEAVPVGTGAMAALMGLDLAAAEQACAEAAQGEVVNVANINSPGQIVIAGPSGGSGARGAGRGRPRGRKSVLLPVSAPFHSALMKPAADRLAAELEQVTPKPPAGARGAQRGRGADHHRRTTSSRSSSARWRARCAGRTACTRWRARAPRRGSRSGPGRVLTGLLKRTIDGARGHAVEDPESLHKAAAAARRGPRGVTEARRSRAGSPSSPAARAASVWPSPARWRRTAPPW